MSIIETLKLTPEEVEQIVAEYCMAAVKNRLTVSKSSPSAVNSRPRAPKTQPRHTPEQFVLYIASQPGKTCPHYKVGWHFHQTTVGHREAIIVKLIADGKIKVRTKKSNNGKLARIYYIPEN